MDGQMTIFDFIPDPTKVYECEIKGLCDDAYCPECGYGFLDNEVDRPECPNCGTRVSWGKYHRINDNQCATCEYRVYLHPKDGNTRQGCTYHGGHGCHYEERKCCNNCNRYRMTVDATTCEPKYMICHRPGTVYGDQITNPESYVCECWEEKGESK